ncbi:MAG: SBBP repeat-containing protein [Bryobacterales bacterium]|nr:SBBP repeat-containing protein [Bryobacterales bacterium]
MIVLFLLGAALASAATKADVPAPANGKLVASYGKLPLHFEPNQGQWDSQVRFASRGPNFGLFLSDTEAFMVLHQRDKVSAVPAVGGIKPIPEVRRHVLRMQLLGASGTVHWSGQDQLPGVSNYYVSDAGRPELGVPQFRSARANGVYPGVDAVYYSQNRTLEYDFVVHPGADPSAIRMQWSGVDKVSLTASGDLSIATSLGNVVHEKPNVYQIVDGKRVAVEARYTLTGNQVQFALGNYDRQHDVVIDPVVRSYSTLLGGAGNGSTLTGDDYGLAVAVDSSGRAFLAGSTASVSFPGNNAARSGTSDAYVTQLNTSGSAILFTTYIGGSGVEQIEALAVDGSNRVYGAGRSSSPSLPGASNTNAGAEDAFLFRLNPAALTPGSIDYLRFVGGSGNDYGKAVAVNASSELYFVGWTESTNLPANVTGGTTAAGGRNVFVGKLDSAGAPSLLRYFGGSGHDYGLAIAVDSFLNVYIGGSSACAGGGPGCANDLPLGSPLRPYTAPTNDGFVLRFSPNLTSIDWSTFIGGSALDEVVGVALDGNGNVYAGGYSGSSNFPIIFKDTTATNPSPNGANDMFVVKIGCVAPITPGQQCAGSHEIKYSSVFGGRNNDWMARLTADRQGSVYIAGYGETGFPTFAAPTASHFTFGGGLLDGVFAKVTPGGRSLLYSMYLGGVNDDLATGVALDSQGNAYVSGYTLSGNFPTTIGSALQGGADAFVVKLGPYAVPTAAFISPGNAIEFGTFGDKPIDTLGGNWGDAIAVAQRKSTGDTYIVAKDAFGSLYARVFFASTQSWGAWYGPAASISGTPAIAVNEISGVAYVVVRGLPGPQGEVLYYWASLNPNTGFGPAPFASKLAGGGLFSTDPAMASCADGNTYVVGKGWAAGIEEQPLWMVRINSSGTPGGTWISGGGLLKGKPSLTCGTDVDPGTSFNYVYLAARDKTNNTWASRILGDSWVNWPATGNPWLSTGGAFLTQDPKLAASGDGKLFLVAAIQGGLIMYTPLPQGSTQSIAWVHDGTAGFVDNYSPAGVSGDLFVAGRKTNTNPAEPIGDQFFWWRSSNAATFGNGVWDRVFVRGLNTTSPLEATPK